MTVNETTPKGGRRTTTNKARAQTEPTEQAAPANAAEPQALSAKS